MNIESTSGPGVDQLSVRYLQDPRRDREREEGIASVGRPGSGGKVYRRQMAVVHFKGRRARMEKAAEHPV
jgi:hypothetical protein